jgi:hypothetical protein
VFKGGWKIPKGYQETINPGTDNIMAKIGKYQKGDMYLLAISKIFANRIKMLSTLVVVAHSAPSTIMINL